MNSICLGPLHIHSFARENPCLPFNPLPSAPVSFSRAVQIGTLHQYISIRCLYWALPSLRCRWALKARKYVARAFDCHGTESHSSVRCNVHFSNGTRLRFDSSTLERLVPSGGTSKRVFLANSNMRNTPRHVRIEAFNPQGGGGRVVVNLAIAGVLTYLTVTGRLNWLFEAILFIWIFFSVLFWILERNLIKGRCPNCGGEFQVFEFSVKEGPRFCPYCSQPFKLENKQFVREGPQFSNDRRQDSKWPFGGFGQQPASTPERKTSEAVVDIEAEVRDKD